MLSVVHFCLLSFGIVMQSVPPILTAIVAELSLTYAQGGLLMSFFSLPSSIMAIPSGLLADRYNQKTIFAISLILVIAGAALFFKGTALYMLLLGRTITGIGAAALFVIAPQIISQWFSGKESGLAMGVFNTAIPLSSVIALNLFSVIGERVGWRTCIYPSVGLPLLATIVTIFLFRHAPVGTRTIGAQSNSILQDIRKSGLSIWLVGSIWMFYNVVILSLLTFTPDYLNTIGFSITSSGFITSAIMWPSLIIGPIIGIIIDRIDHKYAILFTANILVLIAVVALPYATGWVLGLITMVGIAQALIAAPIFTLASEVVEPERLGLAFGILITLQNLGALIGPIITGLVRDATGSYESSFLLMSGFILLVFASIVALMWKQRQHKTQRQDIFQ